MLVLTRRVSEAIRVGHHVRIVLETVDRIPGFVQIIIHAPRSVTIAREEVYRPAPASINASGGPMGQLRLTRKVDEAFIIGGVVRVLVVSIDRHTRQVQLGFNAPPDVVVLREELYIPTARHRRG